MTARSTGSRSWRYLAELLEILRALPTPAALSPRTVRAARALATALARDIAREYPTQRAEADAWGVDPSTLRRRG